MTADDRNELVRTLVVNYVAAKANDKVWAREHSSDYYISLGKLLGCLTAFELNMEENENGIIVTTRGNGKIVLRFDV